MPGNDTIPRRSAAGLSRWKKALFSLVVLLVFFAVLELVLYLSGVRPSFYDEDPYVGFSSQAPLFVEDPSAGDAGEMVTAKNKLRWFTPQRFARRKPAGTLRIFCVGGSTTYGRPYADATSFSGWLRELLPVVDGSRTWEVVNAGGISYASYRVAMVMEELARYAPDLFVIYSGHNEFLERRTYAGLIETPAPVRGLGALVSRTRTYAAVQGVVDFLRSVDERAPGTTRRLAGEVDTLLNRSVGPSAYRRDDAWRSQVLAHYRYSLARMVDIARSAGARAILVTPASNLRHASPFKSEHRAGLSASELERFEALFARAREADEARRPDAALTAIEAALGIDHRHAGAHYRRARILDGLERYAAARAAYQRALEEDVCPLRAPALVGAIVREVAAGRGVPLVDFAAILEERAADGIPGDDLFLDHVHPTIAMHRELALELVEALAREGIAQPGPAWQDVSQRRALIGRIEQRVEGRIDIEAHGAALRELAGVLAWAGKFEDAYRTARRALELASEDGEAHFQSGRCAQILGRTTEAVEHYRRALEIGATASAVPYYYAETHSNLAVIIERAGELAEAESLYRRAVELRPDLTEAQYNLGVLYSLQGRLAEAEARFLRALSLAPEFPEAEYNLGVVYEREGRFLEAAARYERALGTRPDYARARARLEAVRRSQTRPSGHETN